MLEGQNTGTADVVATIASSEHLVGQMSMSGEASEHGKHRVVQQPCQPWWKGRLVAPPTFVRHGQTRRRDSRHGQRLGPVKPV